MKNINELPKGSTHFSIDERGGVIFLKYENGVLMVYSPHIGWELADEEYFK